MFPQSSVHRSIASPSIGCSCRPFSNDNRCSLRSTHLLKEGPFFDFTKSCREQIGSDFWPNTKYQKSIWIRKSFAGFLSSVFMICIVYAQICFLQCRYKLEGKFSMLNGIGTREHWILHYVILHYLCSHFSDGKGVSSTSFKVELKVTEILSVRVNPFQMVSVGTLQLELVDFSLGEKIQKKFQVSFYCPTPNAGKS